MSISAALVKLATEYRPTQDLLGRRRPAPAGIASVDRGASSEFFFLLSVHNLKRSPIAGMRRDQKLVAAKVRKAAFIHYLETINIILGPGVPVRHRIGGGIVGSGHRKPSVRSAISVIAAEYHPTV